MKADAGPVRGYSRAHFMRRRLAWIAAGKAGSAAATRTARKPIPSFAARAARAGPDYRRARLYRSSGRRATIRSGALALRFKDGGERLFRPGEKHPLQTIIVAASASKRAMRSHGFARERIALLLSTHSGEFLSMFAMDRFATRACAASIIG